MKQPRTLIEHGPALNGDRVFGPQRPLATSAMHYSAAREPQYAWEPQWRYEAPPVPAPGLERHNHQPLPQAAADHFTHTGLLSGEVTQDLATLPHAAVMAERSRLAREIHDTLVQEFAGILLHLEAVKGSDDAAPLIGSERLACAKELAKCGLEDARRMLLDLRPRSLEGATLPDALRRLAERFSRDCGIPCEFRAAGRARDLPAKVQDELYRVAQEALCNVRKHSRATAASVALGYGPGVVVLKIKDNGQGFATVPRQAGGRGYGLTTMRERAHRLGGSIEINSTPGTGTEVGMMVALPAKPQ